MSWNDAVATPPTDGREVIVYTEEGHMKMCSYIKGRWGTYFKVTHWMEKPEPPAQEELVVKRKRGRPRK